MKKLLIFVFFAVQYAFPQPTQMDAGDLQLAINKLSVLGSVLYVGAHPDDENTALLAYFAKGKLYRTAYLAITRGEGGQNLLGSEQGSELGLIRTQELLDARKIDGASQFFSRAIDFGYSKSSEEALRLWNKDSVLKDVVFVIRKFRPDIIITRFSPTMGGHGHHLASAILADEAFKISGDPNVYPEQLQYVKPWKATRILFNEFHWGNFNSNADNAATIKVDVGAYNPVLGKSYTELAGISRSMHKSQGMGASQRRGSSTDEFVVTDGEPASKDVMQGIDLTWGRLGDKNIAREVSAIQHSFSIQDPARAVPALATLYKDLAALPESPWITIKREEVKNLIVNCLGLWMDVNADASSYSPGSTITVRASFVDRSDIPVSVSTIEYPELHETANLNKTVHGNDPVDASLSCSIPRSTPLTQPYFLHQPPTHSRYAVDDPSLVGDAETKPSLTAVIHLTVQNVPLQCVVPVQYRWVDHTRGELYRNVVIVPPVSVWTNEKNIVGKNDSSSIVTVTVQALQDSVSGTVSLDVPAGWDASSPQTISLPVKEAEAVLQFSVKPDRSAHSGTFTACVAIGREQYSHTVKTIDYPHIAPQTLLEQSGGNLLHIDMHTRGKTIGYIMGAGDYMPDALRQMGYTVSLVTDDELKNDDLQKYDAIIAGVRAYNTREQLRISNANLLSYVKNGGTYIVQYQTVTRGETDNIAPYPLQLSHDRVTDEDAHMTFLDPTNPVLNYPNTITQKDFEGWVQERGLYFAHTWDKKFQPILSCSDPNEQPMDGSLLIATYGKGYYIFTGLAFFRQLPAGVGGAYRLFANLVSIGK